MRSCLLVAVPYAVGLWMLQGCADPPVAIDHQDLERRNAALAVVRKERAQLLTNGADYALTALSHEDHRVRVKAAERLADFDPLSKEQVDGLITALSDSAAPVRIAATRALANSGDPSAIDPLIALLTDQEASVRLWAGKAIRKYERAGIHHLIHSLSADSPLKDHSYENLAGKKVTLRRGVKDFLASMGKTAVPQLIEALDEKTEPLIRHNISGVLGRMGEEAKEALPAMIKAFDSGDARMRKNVVADIGKIGDHHPEVMPTLKRAAADANKEIASAARRAMRAIKKQANKKKNKGKKK